MHIPENLIKLFVSLTGRQPDHVQPLAEGGSARRYFRLSADGQSYIGTFNPVVAENLAFRHYLHVFRQYGLPVPELLLFDKSATCYLQQDLGDVSLYKLVQQNGGMQQAPESLMAHFRQALEHLLHFQVEAHKSINYRKFAFAGSRFDKAAILDDLNYFRYYFLRLHPSLRVNERLLMRDMQRFGAMCAAAPSGFFMYRDFQSRNIMIFNDSNYYIDFQGGRQGALQYDVVSLLWQAMAGFTQEQRETLLDTYKAGLGSLQPEAAASFDTYLPMFVHLRQMQVLGAYGLRGLVQHKVHFVKSIAPALRSVARNLQHYPLPDRLPHLQAALQGLESLHELYPMPEQSPEKQLTVEVFSFSYLQGGPPPDHSGHGGGFVFDCRALPNPGKEERYRPLTGRDAEVAEYLSQKEEVRQFLEFTGQLSEQAISKYQRRGFTHLSIGFGCTGGRHRSVFCAETLVSQLQTKYPEVRFNLRHHNISL